MNFEEAKGEKTKGEPKSSASQRVGTLVDFKITFFPHESDDKIIYLKNLHMFTDDNWVSIGIKPRAKDIKSVIEDIQEMEYIKSVEDEYSPSVVVDGKKVRIGLQSYELDPFYETYQEEGEYLTNLSQLFDDKNIEAVLEFQLQLTQKLDTILSSEDPIITEICKGLKLEGSMKFHNKQFRKVLEESTEKKWKDFSNSEEEKKDEGDNEEGDKSEKKSESHEDHDSHEDSEENDDDDDDDNEDSDEGYGDDESGDEDEDEDEDDDSESKSKFDLKSFFKYTLPLFMFKQKSKIELNPDVNDIKQYCLKF